MNYSGGICVSHIGDTKINAFGNMEVYDGSQWLPASAAVPTSQWNYGITNPGNSGIGGILTTSMVPNGGWSGMFGVPPPKPKVQVEDLKPTIRQHHRIYDEELVLLATAQPNLIVNFTRNRLLVGIENIAEGFDLYVEWLDQNVRGLYYIKRLVSKLTISFEHETDLMQFVLSFK